MLSWWQYELGDDEKVKRKRLYKIIKIGSKQNLYSVFEKNTLTVLYLSLKFGNTFLKLGMITYL